MIVLFTDFGLAGPYVGQVKAVLAERAAIHTIVDLQHDAPACDPRAAAYLLAPLIEHFPPASVFLCVVDPGVGGERSSGVLRTADQWFVGADNGLFEMVIRRALARGEDVRWWDITWCPRKLSASFHGRDIFASIAAQLANGQGPESEIGEGFEERQISSISRGKWPDDLYQVIYIDGFGNAMTGIRAARLDGKPMITVNGHNLSCAKTFSGVTEGAKFWYENSCGLVEISVNKGRASDILGFKIGTVVSVERL